MCMSLFSHVYCNIPSSGRDTRRETDSRNGCLSLCTKCFFSISPSEYTHDLGRGQQQQEKAHYTRPIAKKKKTSIKKIVESSAVHYMCVKWDKNLKPVLLLSHIPSNKNQTNSLVVVPHSQCVFRTRSSVFYLFFIFLFPFFVAFQYCIHTFSW